MVFISSGQKGSPEDDALTELMSRDNPGELDSFFKSNPTVVVDDETFVVKKYTRTQQTYDAEEGTWWNSGTSTEYARYPLVYYAATVGSTETLKYLLVEKGLKADVIPDRMRVENSDTMCVTGLIRAVINKNKDVVEILLENGANPAVLDGQGQSPLSLALKLGEVGIAQILLSHSADINQSIAYQATWSMAAGALGSGYASSSRVHSPIHFAHVETLKWCSDNSANLEAVRKHSSLPFTSTPVLYTPLLFAVADRDWKRASILVSLGADVYARTDGGQNVFDLMDFKRTPSDFITEMVLQYFRNIHSTNATAAKYAGGSFNPLTAKAVTPVPVAAPVVAPVVATVAAVTKTEAKPTPAKVQEPTNIAPRAQSVLAAQFHNASRTQTTQARGIVDDLKAKVAADPVLSVNLTCLEELLDDADFFKVFSQPRKTFLALPDWQKKAKKKAVGLLLK